MSGVSAILVAVSGPHPTGNHIIDLALVLVAASAAVWACATAPWWAIAAMATAATAFSAGIWIAVGATAAVAAFAIGIFRRRLPVVRALSAATSIVVLANLDNRWFFGYTSLLGLSICIAAAAFGLRRRPSAQRLLAYKLIGGTTLAAIAAVIGFALAAASGRGEAESGNRFARQGLSQLGNGDLTGAQDSFVAADKSFAAASDSIDQIWAQPARLVPGLAQNRNSLVALAHEAAHITHTLATVLPQVDLEKLRVSKGRIDIAAVKALQGPLAQMQQALSHLDATVKEIASPWLVSPFTHRLESLSSQIEQQRTRSDNAAEAIKLAPALLGAEGKRVYFIAFTTPSELRGIGGFMGNWAELTIDNGHISMSDFGRTQDLENRGDPTTKTVTGPTEFLDRYGRFNFNTGPGGTASSDVWHSITVSPHFPDVANVITQLYPQSGGRHLDGVFAMDVEVLAALMQFTDPIPIDNYGTLISSENAVEFLLRGQYNINQNNQRIDLLETIAKTTFEQLLNGALPSPERLAKVLGPFAQTRRLIAWSQVPAEEQLFSDIKMSGPLPDLQGGEGIGLAMNNASGNKIDAYLKTGVDYTSKVDPTDGTTNAELTLTLNNTATSSIKMPDYVVSNLAGLPRGSSELFVSLYSALDLDSVTLDGEPVGSEPGTEHGWHVYSFIVDIAPESTATLHLQLSGTLDPAAPRGVTVLLPPMANPTKASVVYDGKATPINRAGVTQVP
jgi:hypothetical protein